MFNIIYSEFLKLKKSYIIIIALIVTLFIPIVMVIEMGKDNCIKGYIVNMDFFQIQFIYIVIFSLISSYIFSREFIDKTANVIYSYPMSRMKIFFGKFITILMIILFIYVINFFIRILILYAIWGWAEVKDVINYEVKILVYSFLAQILIIPIPILIGGISKNIIFSVIYGVLGAVSSIFMMISGIYMQCSPLMIPFLPVCYFYVGDPIDFILVPIVGVSTFVISMFLCIYHYNNIEIN
ncbi:ABC transporter permease [Clostridium weizhouense]|uniref:ABC transporter permease n=1 Tax=Clostridium weizhouense TaxID=2859781 RepID=A0ABS7APZ9_9CLOT|nr:ABC transporter permease [Clostridium weizhouense]MBW6410738.1 ABC transporter permease [Clostridium weizhouense]